MARGGSIGGGLMLQHLVQQHHILTLPRHVLTFQHSHHAMLRAAHRAALCSIPGNALTTPRGIDAILNASAFVEDGMRCRITRPVPSSPGTSTRAIRIDVYSGLHTC